jgi:hypothetical protein
MDETLEKSNCGLVRPLVGTLFLWPESAQKSADDKAGTFSKSIQSQTCRSKLPYIWHHFSRIHVILAAHFILDRSNAARGLVPAMRVLTSLHVAAQASMPGTLQRARFLRRCCCCARLVGSLVLLQACQRGITIVGGGFDAFL